MWWRAGILCLAACSPVELGADASSCAPIAPTSMWMGRHGAIVRIVMTNPAPPARFTNWWAVTVTDPDGAPMFDPLQLEVSAVMAEDDQVSPTPTTVTAESDALVVGPLELSTPGRWEVRFDLAEERIVVPVCVDE